MVRAGTTGAHHFTRRTTAPWRAGTFLAALFLGLPALTNGTSQAATGETVVKSAPVIPVVVELFTSEGCSSCPPADALLRRLAKEPGVITLSFHVDYWNRLGWTDPFSAPEWTARQRTYERTLRSPSGVYTPQMVINGRYDVVGSDERRLRTLLEEARSVPLPVDLAVDARSIESGKGNATEVVVHALPGRLAEENLERAELLVLLCESGFEVSVLAGENARRRLAHDSVVRVAERGKLRGGEWRATIVEPEALASSGFQVSTKENGDPPRPRHVVALLQDAKTQRIIGAAMAVVGQ